MPAVISRLSDPICSAGKFTAANRGPLRQDDAEWLFLLIFSGTLAPEPRSGSLFPSKTSTIKRSPSACR